MTSKPNFPPPSGIPVFTDPNCPPGVMYGFSQQPNYRRAGVSLDDSAVGMEDAIKETLVRLQREAAQAIYVASPNWNFIKHDPADVFGWVRQECTAFLNGLSLSEFLNMEKEAPSRDARWPEHDQAWAFEYDRDGYRIGLTITCHADWVMEEDEEEDAEVAEPYKRITHQDVEIYRYDNECGIDGAKLLSSTVGLEAELKSSLSWFYNRWLERRAA